MGSVSDLSDDELIEALGDAIGTPHEPSGALDRFRTTGLEFPEVLALWLEVRRRGLVERAKAAGAWLEDWK